MDAFDLIVIGGGPAGYCAAERAGKAGLRVLLLEKRALGGVCLNEGCIPSKALLYSAKVLDSALHGEKYGVTVSGAKIDQATVLRRKSGVVKRLVAGVAAKMKASGVTVVKENALILGKRPEGFIVEAAGYQYTGRNLLIATGSEPAVPPIPGLKENLGKGFVLTNREILDLPQIPERLVVIGGGVIGLEMASYYQTVGSAVTVVEMLDSIGGPIDREIAENLLKNYQKKGVAFELGAKVTAVEDSGVVFERGGQTEKVPADKVLLSIGRRPVTQGYGLESLKPEMDRAALKADDRGRTSVPGLYAAGDVNGRSMLAHTAYREAEVAVNTILGKRDRVRYDAIPAVIYTSPEVACVGLTLAEAEKRCLDASCHTVSLRYSGRYLAENEGGDGFVKLVVDRKHRTLLGVHMIGPYASEIIYGAALMLETELPVSDLRELVFPHPTVGEAIREALFEI